MGEIRCGDCDAVLARTSATGVPLRPIWPGYETIEARRDGSRYVLVKCVHCEGAPPLTWRQSAVLLAVYALALGFSGYLAVILKDLATWQGPHAPWDLIAAGMVAAVMAAWGLWAARQQRWKWIRAAADQPH